MVGTFQGTGGGPPLQAQTPPAVAGNLQKPGCTITKKRPDGKIDLDVSAISAIIFIALSIE
jgi:hypothetical protein